LCVKIATSSPVILGGASLVGKMTLDFKKKKVDLQMILPGQKKQEKNKKKASRNKTTQNRDVV